MDSTLPGGALPAAASRDEIADRPRRIRGNQRSFWLKQLHQWHWISAALCLTGMLLFAVTGITLNHAGQIESMPVVREQQETLPEPLRDALRTNPPAKSGPLPLAVRDWLSATLGLSAGSRDAEWSRDEVYLALPRPGGDAWVSIGLDDGAVVHETTDRGWISYLNDLHKGRHTGAGWSWFIDIFAGACLVFCSTGLVLLQFHAGNRPATWPMVGLGLVAPLLLAILFIH